MMFYQKSQSVVRSSVAIVLACLSVSSIAQISGARTTVLPDPQIAQVDLPRPACNNLSREALRNSVGTASQAVNERLTSPIRGELYVWAEQKLRYTLPACIEWPYAIGKLQQALGNPVTRTLEMVDVEKIQLAMDRGREDRAKQADGRVDLEEGYETATAGCWHSTLNVLKRHQLVPSCT